LKGGLLGGRKERTLSSIDGLEDAQETFRNGREAVETLAKMLRKAEKSFMKACKILFINPPNSTFHQKF
jgi:hypothetical protein